MPIILRVEDNMGMGCYTSYIEYERFKKGEIKNGT